MGEVKALAEDVRWISVREAALILRLSHTKVHQMIKAGQIEVVGTFTGRKDVVLDRDYIVAKAQELAAERAA